MKKTVLLLTFVVVGFVANAQAAKMLNLGGLGTGLYGSLEFPVHSAITIAPMVSTDWDFNSFVIAAKGNYYFDELFELGSAWDVYAGVNLGWKISDDGQFNFGGQVGGRWFWSEKWGINAEFGGGSGVTGGVGVTMKM